MKYYSINGERLKTLAINDRGLAYGDGLFTTAKIVNGQIELLEQHIQRLVNGCNQLAISLPMTLLNGKLTQYLSLIVKEHSSAVLKVIITAGTGGRGYSRQGLTDDATNVIVMIFDYPQHNEKLAKTGVTLGFSLQKMSISPMLAGVKHLNRLEQVLFKQELDNREEDDLVVMNNASQVVEATSGNLFYWLNGQLCTPDVSVSGVNGLMRQFVIANYNQCCIQCENQCKNQCEDREVGIVHTTLEHLALADAMFTCNAITGILPVKIFNKRLLALDKPQRLRQKIQEIIGD